MLTFKANVRSKEITLPIGIYLKKQDQRFNTCVVEAMDGDVEEQISEKKLKNNGAKIVTRLLAQKVKKVGDIDFPNGIGETLAREMFTDDRDTCLIEIRGLMKDDMEVNPRCPHCGNSENDIIFISDMVSGTTSWGDNEKYHNEALPVGEIDFELPDGIIIVNSEEQGKEVICKKGRIRLPNGVIEENITQNGLNNPGKANTLLLSSCIVEIENIRKIDQYVVKAMSRVDREYLSELISDAKPGPKFIVSRTCSDCDSEYKFMLQLPYFFTSGTGRM